MSHDLPIDWLRQLATESPDATARRERERAVAERLAALEAEVGSSASSQ